jgi:hypothetical protein
MTMKLRDLSSGDTFRLPGDDITTYVVVNTSTTGKMVRKSDKGSQISPMNGDTDVLPVTTTNAA